MYVKFQNELKRSELKKFIKENRELTLEICSTVNGLPLEIRKFKKNACVACFPYSSYKRYSTPIFAINLKSKGLKYSLDQLLDRMYDFDKHVGIVSKIRVGRKVLWKHDYLKHGMLVSEGII